ncbi:histone deacetylase domain-containing protein [Cantharellus anzutake]|uniref:histone deacetylase domain-containing protein n=1 Tax=Cantharellus anzutake TaxID=1750568 RepID=UPI001903DE14|nr:histone deacetylase domain-containing protein [Cantharellus anzutake]KAF8328210.1 histone deacetylase domain-containing protein [Cantharellus anzutake]
MSPESEVAVLLQPRGLLHRFIRHRDLSSIVERPERLRAVAIGIAAARAALEVQRDRADPALGVTDGLVDAILKLRIDGIESTGGIAFHILSANFSSNSLASAAVRFIHGEPSEYLSKVLSWALNSEDVIRRGESEIPKGFSQGDLYLCPQSIDALSGAVSAVFQAVDMVLGSKVTNKVGTGSSAEGCTIPVSSTSSAHDSPSADNAVLETAHPSLDEPQQVPLPPSPTGTSAVGYSNVKRVFVCIRPPGHHCSDDTPSGFCFINNILIAASHAHIRYGIKRAVILDIDLHHGNGTQAIAWSINAETAREEESNVLTEEGRDLPGTGLKVFYGSLHDILSFPCEDGEPKATQAASTILRGAHGQYIENVHLESYTDEADFFLRLYPSYLNTLLGGAREFLEATQATSEDTMVYISAGFDASLHEHPYMSRHNRNVPTAFYSRFAVDVRAFAEECCNGRIVAVLEGGYSDRALISGSGAFMQGLAVDSAQQLATDWWNVIA